LARFASAPAILRAIADSRATPPLDGPLTALKGAHRKVGGVTLPRSAWRFLERALIAIRRHGVRDAFARAARRLAWRVHAHERHTWYELDVEAERPRPALANGFRLRLAEEPDLARVAALREATTVPVMRRLRAAGHELWIVDGSGVLGFACWVFRARAPVAAAKGRWIDLPESVVCLEDSLTAPEMRGRGIAPGAWCALADHLREQGVRTLVTKTEHWNEPSHRALAKAGFRETARMTLDRRWGRSRVTVTPLKGRAGPMLAELIAGSPERVTRRPPQT
jgi:RimJ/RimL family protein N-acetyltransferase